MTKQELFGSDVGGLIACYKFFMRRMEEDATDLINLPETEHANFHLEACVDEMESLCGHIEHVSRLIRVAVKCVRDQEGK